MCLVGVERSVEPLRRAGASAVVLRRPVVGAPASAAEGRQAHRSSPDVAVIRGSGSASTLGGEGLAEALPGPGQERSCCDVADAEGCGELEAGEVMQLGEQERRPLAFRNALQGTLEVAREVGLHHEVLGRRDRAARLAGPGQEADDLLAADVVERDAMGDLVEPGPGVLGLLEGVVRAVGLDERVLGQVGGELRVADHPDQVGVDLAVVLGEQLLDEEAGTVVVPGTAHRRTAEYGPGRAEVAGKAADHRSSEEGVRREPSDSRRPVHGAETRRSVVV